MAIPDFQSIMLPLLKHIQDGREYNKKETEQELAKIFNLTDEEMSEKSAISGQGVFINRAAWAKAYFKMAGLVEDTRRAHFKITPSGLSLLAKNPTNINVKLLKQLGLKQNENHNAEEIINHLEITDSDILVMPSPVNNTTPEEEFENSYKIINNKLADDLLDIVRKMNPYDFEKLVVDLLCKMGYGGSDLDNSTITKKSGDEGIDGIIKEDRLGLEMIYVQAKRWKEGNTIGRPEIQKFMGALVGQGAKKGVFITASSFTKDAIDYTPRNDTRIVLIDGNKLADLMIEYNVGVSTKSVFSIKQIDNDYFE